MNHLQKFLTPMWVWQIYGQAKPGRFGRKVSQRWLKKWKAYLSTIKKSNKTRFGVGLGRIFCVATTQKERNIYIYIFEWFCSSIVALDYELKNVIPCSWNATTVNNTPASPYLNIPCWLKICSRNVFTCGSCSDLTSCLCLKQDLHKKTLAFTWE